MRAWLTPLRETGLTFAPQAAGDLGERLIAATVEAIGAGAEAVVLIGGDCPYLGQEHFEEAARILATGQVALGPARDGGYYLIALRRPEPALFTGIAWSSPHVLEQTRARCAAVGLRVGELAELEDVDDEASWQRAVAAGVFS